MVATHYRWDFVGLSTDDKPTADNPKVTNGSTFYESDTSKYYIWYNDQWYEKVVSGGGGGGGTAYDPSDPDDIYNKTRPDDWLELPDPEEGECYILIQVPSSYGGANVSLPMYLANGVKEYGFVEDGEFVPITEHNNYSYVPFSIFDYETSEGNVQLICRLTSETATTFPSVNSGKGEIWRQFVAEIKFNVPTLTTISLGTTASYTYCENLRYISFYNTTDSLTSINCRYSYNLLCVRGAEGLGKNITNYSYMFQYCQRLISAPNFDTSNATDCNHMFSACLSLQYIPNYNMKKVTSLADFEGSFVLTKLPALETSSALTNVSGCFSTSNMLLSDLSGVENMDLSGVTSMTMFIYLPPQTTLKFKYLPTSISGYNFVQLFGNIKYNLSELSSTNIVITKDDAIVTIAGTTSASNFCPLDTKMYVPDALYEDYIADTKWSTISSRIFKLSELPA